jgi:hypothetical protein
MKEPLPLCAWCKVERVKLRKNETCSQSCGAALRWHRAEPMTNERRLAACNAGRRTWMAKRLAAAFKAWAERFGIPQTHAMLKAYTTARTTGYLTGYAANYAKRRSLMIRSVLSENPAHDHATREDRARRVERRHRV